MYSKSTHDSKYRIGHMVQHSWVVCTLIVRRVYDTSTYQKKVYDNSNEIEILLFWMWRELLGVVIIYYFFFELMKGVIFYNESRYHLISRNTRRRGRRYPPN